MRPALLRETKAMTEATTKTSIEQQRAQYDEAWTDGCQISNATADLTPPFEWECGWCLAGPSKGHASIAAAHAHYASTHLPKCPRRTPTRGERDDRPQVTDADPCKVSTERDSRFIRLSCTCGWRFRALLEDTAAHTARQHEAGEFEPATRKPNPLQQAQGRGCQRRDADPHALTSVSEIGSWQPTAYSARCACGWSGPHAETRERAEQYHDLHAMYGPEDDDPAFDAEEDAPAHVVAISVDAVDGYRAECGCGWARVWAETDPLQRLADAHAAKGVEDDCSELDG